MKNSSIKKLIILIFCLVGLIGIYAFFFVKILDNSQKLSDLTNKTEEAKRNEKMFAVVERFFKDSGADIKKLSGFFVESNNVVKFVEYVENLGTLSKTNLSISTIVNEGETGDGKNGFKILMSIKALGQWSGVMKLISLIENMPYKIEIKNVELSVSDPKKKEWQTSISFSVLSK